MRVQCKVVDSSVYKSGSRVYNSESRVYKLQKREYGVPVVDDSVVELLEVKAGHWERVLDSDGSHVVEHGGQLVGA